MGMHFKEVIYFSNGLSKLTYLSESMTVCNLWAIVNTVQLWNSLLMVDCTKLSVSMSTEAVASSRTRIFVFRSKARARQTSCLCPTLLKIHLRRASQAHGGKGAQDKAEITMEPVCTTFLTTPYASGKTTEICSSCFGIFFLLAQHISSS